MFYPDPASRFQPDGPHGASAVVDLAGFAWADADWDGVKLAEQVIYELHVGTFTPEGSWAAAAERLPLLVDIGITTIEVMPIAEFPGRFGWGYDGVDLFEPSHLYGRPEDVCAFVDRAHALGIGVILDVVYNHIGPDGNYLAQFTPDYFTVRYTNEWGDAINFDGDNAAGVREFVLANVRMWIAEYHFDGLRLDATQAIHDASEPHILQEVVTEARNAGSPRSVIVVAENEPQEARLLQPKEAGGFGIDAVWNDDFHHSAIVALSGRRQAYFSDHAGTAQEFIAAAKYGYLFQGQVYSWQADRRGQPALGMAPARFVTFVENHDQVANTGHGIRFQHRTTPGRARAMTALMLLLSATPMLFQGQEFWAESPFLYFADHKPELGGAVREGRRGFLAQFPSLADEDMSVRLSDPGHPQTFARSTLDWSERERNREALALHRDLIRLRRETPVFAAQRKGGLDGVVLGQEAMALRFFSDAGDDRLLLVNLGLDLNLKSIADPLVAPPFARSWRIEWSSENPIYGGGGTPPVEHKAGWYLPGHAAIVMAAVQLEEAPELPDPPQNPALKGSGLSGDHVGTNETLG
jgi:maltooligosyltrehalose trehalohydrolase